MTVFCILITLLITFVLRRSSSIASNNRQNAFYNVPTIFAMVLFSLFVGLRYNPVIDPDFLGYWMVAEEGDSCFEYYRFEPLPRFLASMLLLFNMPPSAWFIVMGFFLISFTLFAASRQKYPCYHIVFLFFVILYLSHNMNIVRQGVALSAFLCAVTYISERNWKKYLLFMVIAFGFHKSAILWLPLYLLSYLDWDKDIVTKYLLIFIGITGVMMGFLFVVQKFTFIFELINMASALEAVETNDMMENETVGSGIGIVLRYVRWVILIFVVPRVALQTHDRNLMILFAIFIIGFVMDIFTMYFILTSRIALYPKIIEILLYVYLFKPAILNHHIPVMKVIRPVLYIQILAMTYSLCNYFAEWNFVFLM